jgi:hypothetical protein
VLVETAVARGLILPLWTPEAGGRKPARGILFAHLIIRSLNWTPILKGDPCEEKSQEVVPESRNSPASGEGATGKGGGGKRNP